MTWNRRKRFAIVLFALVNLLFMQLALAAYACPSSLSAEASAQLADVKASGMPCAEAMALATDEAQPGLCAAHCKSDQQTSDKYELLAPQALAEPASDYPLLRMNLPSLVAPLEAPLLTRTPARSVALRHCCFRL